MKNTFQRRRIQVLQHGAVRTGRELIESVLASLDAAAVKKIVKAGLEQWTAPLYDFHLCD